MASYFVVRCFSRQPWWCVHITPCKHHHSAELFEGTKHTNCLLVCVCGEVYRHNDITLRPRQNGRHLPDDIFKCIFLNENVLISIKISLKFVPKGQINNILALVWIMAWRRPGDKPLSEPKMGIYWRIYASLGLNEILYLMYGADTFLYVDDCENI